MNKQQRYLSLLLLTSAVSGIKSMELVDAPNQEDAQDKFAMLKPQLTQERRETLEAAINWLDTEIDGLPEHLCAYLAAVELEIDAHPLARDKAQERKELWAKIKLLTQDATAARLAVDYLTGSEDEQEAVDRVDRLIHRVHRRDRQLKNQATASKNHSLLMEAQKAQAAQLTAQLDALLAIKKPMDHEAQQLALQQMDLLAKEIHMQLTQSALDRLVTHIASFAQDEQLLASASKEQLTPAYQADLNKKKDAIALELAQIIVARHALEQKIAPLTKQEEHLKEEQEKAAEAQSQLVRVMKQTEKAQELAQTDRYKLLAALDEMIENSTNATEKATLKVARAKADGTYSTAKWALGFYK